MLIELSTTCPNKEEARIIAKLAIENNLCSCAHIYEMETFYSWNNKIENETEYKLLFKTDDSNFNELAELIKKNHSYQLPAIYSVPINIITDEYKQWIVAHSDKNKK